MPNNVCEGVAKGGVGEVARIGPQEQHRIPVGGVNVAAVRKIGEGRIVQDG